MSVAIPDFLLSRALARGIPRAEVPQLWEDHCAWCRTNGIDAGGKPWDRFLDSVIADLKDRVALDRGDDVKAEGILRQRRLARVAKAERDATYKSKAVTLTEWLELLRADIANPDGQEVLSRAEVALSQAPPPPRHVHAGEWIMSVLTSEAVRLPRVASCGFVEQLTGEACGMPVEATVAHGRTYRGGRCVEHRPRA